MQPSAKVHIVRVLTDNFSYIIVDEKTKKAICVDPAEPEKVLREIQKLGAQLHYALCTHHHYDHSGGNVYLKNLNKGISVVGSAYENTPGVTLEVENEQIISFGDLRIKAFHAPCHTKGHILYYVYKVDKQEKENLQYAPILFTGDTIFIAGCGRFFEGTAKDMQKNIEKVKSLRKETLIYCGHEYTRKNLQFALSVEAENEYIKKKLKEVEEKLKKGEHSVPSTVEEENLINPFFRTKYYFEYFNTNDEIEILNKLRHMKNCF